MCMYINLIYVVCVCINYTYIYIYIYIVCACKYYVCMSTYNNMYVNGISAESILEGQYNIIYNTH